MRYYHMDFKFSMYKTEYIKKWFEKLKANGFDGVMLEVDNKLIYPSHPDFAAKDALAAQEWTDIIRYGSQQGLVIYPMLQSLGHMEHILECGDKYSNIAENPGNNYMLCPSKVTTLKFIKDLILDLVKVFDHPHRIHLGGDEVFGHMQGKNLVKCPLCMTKDSSEILNNYLTSLADFCVELNIQPEFWADEILTFPEYIDQYPKNTRFVDWLYDRFERYGDKVGLIWGAFNLYNQSVDEDLTEKLPENIRCMIPYIKVGGGKFNHFYGAEYIRSKGYEAVIASGVRSHGDTYAVPRTDWGIRNVKISEAVCNDLNIDHMVTSWAIRLSHPETTWPALRAIDTADEYNTDELALPTILAPLGDIDKEHLMMLIEAARGFFGIDIANEQYARFEKRYYENYSITIHDIWKSESKNEIIEKLNKRISCCNEVLPVLASNLKNSKGDEDCIRHWIMGLELCMLRSEQTLAILDCLTNGINKSLLSELLIRNQKLMNDFELLWSESVTAHSLEREKEVKFKRDIRVLENMLCE